MELRLQSPEARRSALRYRRRKAGRCILAVEVDETLLADALIANGFLSFTAADDRAAITKALERAIGFWITAAEGNR